MGLGWPAPLVIPARATLQGGAGPIQPLATYCLTVLQFIFTCDHEQHVHPQQQVWDGQEKAVPARGWPG